MTTEKLPKCPECNIVMEARYENNGFQIPNGQEHWEVTELFCPECGKTDAELEQLALE